MGGARSRPHSSASRQRAASIRPGVPNVECRTRLFGETPNRATETTAFTTLLTLPLAYVMTRFAFRGKALLGSLLLLPMIMPPFVGAIGLKQMLARFGSVNLCLAKLGLIAPDHPIDWLGQGGFWGI